MHEPVKSQWFQMVSRYNWVTGSLDYKGYIVDSQGFSRFIYSFGNYFLRIYDRPGTLQDIGYIDG